MQWQIREADTMKASKYVVDAIVGGLFVVVPVYLAILLLLKGMQTFAKVVGPIAALLPAWLPGVTIVSLLLVLVVCFLVGLAVRTRTGRRIRNRLEQVFFERLPGYALVRSLTQRLAGDGGETAWRPALVEIEDALVPAFVIEETEDGRFTVFVPSIPTPFAGAVYILEPQRVHVVDVPFTDAVKSISQWGSGAKNLVAHMHAAPFPR
jgi:uncharacterized membrane protein